MVPRTRGRLRRSSEDRLLSHPWTRIGIAAGVVVLAGLLAKLIDARIGRQTLDPAVATRYGVLRRFPIMSISIACATRAGRNIVSHGDLSAAAAELKQRAKAILGSAYVRDGHVIFPRSVAHKAG